MPGYQKQRATWLDFPTTSTPITAATLNGLETAIFDLKYLTYNVEDYGAVGDGVTNSATAIDAAWAACLVTGGVLYFPTGSYIYNGTGLSATPAGATPILIRGDGEFASRLTFTAVTNAECILMSSAGGVASASSIGGGLEKIDCTFPAGKRGITIKSRQSFSLTSLYLYGGTEAIRIDNSRLGDVSHIFCDQWTTNGINVLGDTYATNWYSDIQLNGAGGSGWAFNYVLGAASGGGLYLQRVLTNAAGLGGFRFEYTGGGTVNAWAFLDSCVADGTFGSDTYLFKKVSSCFLANCFAVNHGSGFAGFAYDAAAYCSQTGGIAYSDTGAGASDFAFRNTCDRLAIVGALTSGPTLDYKTDGTAHTNLQIQSPSNLATAPKTVASATATTLPVAGEVFTISGTTTITSVTASWPGRRVTLIFSGILTFTDGSNLKLASNFVTTADDTISLISDGTNWFETSRSVN